MAQNYPGKPPGWQPQGAPASAIPTPPVAHGASKPGPKPKGVHPVPVGSGAPPPAGGSPGGKSPAAPKPRVEPAFPVKKGRKSDIISLPWAIITILFIVLAYDILTYWQESVSIENTAVGAATWGIYALEGKTPPSAGGNQSASRPGRQPGT